MVDGKGKCQVASNWRVSRRSIRPTRFCHGYRGSDGCCHDQGHYASIGDRTTSGTEETMTLLFIMRVIVVNPSVLIWLSSSLLASCIVLGVLDQPLQGNVNVVLILCRDAVAGDLLCGDGSQSKSLN